MRFFKYLTAAFTALFMTAGIAQADSSSPTSSVGIGGYDPVSYFQKTGPKRGNGGIIADHNGVTYLFSSKDNLKAFKAEPAKYLPAYGGWCALGAAMGKKFVADPEVYELVDGKLYLNLNKDIQKRWQSDIPGFIEKADANWPEIKNKSPNEL